jgi:hypothetical protein
MLFPGLSPVARSLYGLSPSATLSRYRAVNGQLPELILDFDRAVYAIAGSAVENPVQNARLAQAAVDGGQAGLLVEPARSNLVAQSIARPSWNAVGPATMIDQGIDQQQAMFGLFPGLEIVSAGASWHRATPGGLTFQAGQSYGLTIWYAAGTSPQVKFTLYQSSTTPITHLELLGPAGNIMPSVQNNGVVANVVNTAVTDQIYRLQCSFQLNETLTTGWGVGSASGGQGESVVVYAMQIEDGTPPTGYIPTDGSPASRAADMPLLQANGWGAGGANSPAGTIALTATVNGLAETTVADLMDAAGHRLMVLRATNGEVILRRQAGGVTVDLPSGVIIARGAAFSCAFGWDSAGGAISVNGSPASTSTASHITAPNTLRFFDVDAAGHVGPMQLHQLRYFTDRQGNVDLQTLSV